MYFEERSLQVFIAILLPLLVLVVEGVEQTERHPNDGWFNNLQHPDWGAIDTILLRMSKANYSDGSYEPSGQNRPNPLDISNVAFQGNDDLGSLRNRTALLVYFGQQLVEEIVDAQRPGCPREYFNIKVPKDHPYNPHGFEDLHMPFLRSRYDQRTGHSPNNPRQQLNEITPFIDGNLFYGAGKAWEDALRSFNDGLLAATSPDVTEAFPVENDIKLPFANPPIPRDHHLLPVRRFRRYGNPRTHENPFLNALGVVWFRYHNYIAGKIKRKQPNWNDEQIFIAARKRVIAQYQKAVWYEWLPAWLKISSDGKIVDLRKKFPYYGGQLSKYGGYEPTLHPGITVEFQAAAMRYGHTLVPSRVVTQTIRNNVCVLSSRNVPARYTNNTDTNDTTQKVEGVRLCNSFWVPEETLEGSPGVSATILGMMNTRAAREDHVIVSDIRENTFGPLEWSRRDLGALNIQRGRDNGLPGYNDVRKAYDLPRMEKWEDITGRREAQPVLKNLSFLYEMHDIHSPDDLDVFAGGLLETSADGPGELFSKVILEQFLRIRHGDRFWYENRNNNLFADDEIDEIESTSFYDVLASVLDIPIGDRRENVFICSPSKKFYNCHCHDPVTSGPDVHETCEPLRHYDYFEGSQYVYVLVIIILFLFIGITCIVMNILASRRQQELDDKARSNKKRRCTKAPASNEFYATEWVGKTSFGLNSREVLIKLDSHRHKILVSNYSGQVVRMIDVRKRSNWSDGQSKVCTKTSCDKGYLLTNVKVPGEIDLVLHFPTMHERDVVVERIETFFKDRSWEVERDQPMAEHLMWREATTVDERKEILAKFFRGVLKELRVGDDRDPAGSVDRVEEEVLRTKLTRTEFAEAVGLQPQSIFVRNMFLLADTDREGFISFDEFKNYFGILCAGSEKEKIEMLFKMFDTKRSGKLTKENYKSMIKSLWDMNDSGGASLDDMVNRVFDGSNLTQKGYMTLEDFRAAFFNDNSGVLPILNLNLNGQSMSSMSKPFKKKGSIYDRAQSCVSDYNKSASLTKSFSSMSVYGAMNHNQNSIQEPQPKGRFCAYYIKLTQKIDNHWRQIFWLNLYMAMTIGIFAERFYYFSKLREHGGLRRITSYGVSVTRGAASAMMFTYSSLLVTMCRNILTLLRETFLHRFVPFDNAHDMHKIIGWTAVFFTVMHVIGHMFNFYHISTQPSTDMNCYFREFFRSSDTLASFQYWFFSTITGVTGFVMSGLLVVMIVFALPYSRRNLFHAFAMTHTLSYIIYALMFLHGAARVVQEPWWAYFFLGPLTLFVIDKMVTLSRVKVQIPVHEATLLPSEVVNLVFKRPLTFEYQSGQWVRIACPEMGRTEYHPFTLTSAPHEDHLSLHIRAVGPWTNNLRNLVKRRISDQAIKLYLDGPFGESHQDWYRFPVSVLIGGGIGITPFASILKDIAHRYQHTAADRIPCKKVYFMWVTRTQRSFEWMTDIIKQVEEADIVNIDICITQMKDKFDLRTAMLYVCERHFQRIAGLSLFTGLRANTHFGRPKFKHYFQQVKNNHPKADQIGVFSCGPPAMTRNVQITCTEANSIKGPSLIHHYENF